MNGLSSYTNEKSMLEEKERKRGRSKNDGEGEKGG